MHSHSYHRRNDAPWAAPDANPVGDAAETHPFGGPPLTVAEVASYLGVSGDVVRDLIRKGELRAAKVGGQWRVDPADLAAYLSSAFERI